MAGGSFILISIETIRSTFLVTDLESFEIVSLSSIRYKPTSEKYNLSRCCLPPHVSHSKLVFNNSLKSEPRHVTVVTTLLSYRAQNCTDCHHPPPRQSIQESLDFVLSTDTQDSCPDQGLSVLDKILFICKQYES